MFTGRRSKSFQLLSACTKGAPEFWSGTIEGANIIKLYYSQPMISYLGYPTFDSEGHPALVGALTVDLGTRKVRYRDFSRVDNPPVLHRKEQFVPFGYPAREKFGRLTSREEEAGLFSAPAAIGTLRAWQAILASAGLKVSGHRLLTWDP